MKDEAAANAEADRKEKERIDKLNQADAVIFQTEKQLNELGDKIPADQKAPIEEALNKLRDAHKAQDLGAIDSSMEALNKLLHEMSQNMYNQQGGANAGQQQANPNNGQQNGGDDVTDVDFEEVK